MSKKSIEELDTEINIRFKKAISFARKNNYKKAYRILKNIPIPLNRIEPEFRAEIYFKLGLYSSKLNLQKQAIYYFEAAAKLGHDQANRNLCIEKMYSGNLIEGFQCYYLRYFNNPDYAHFHWAPNLPIARELKHIQNKKVLILKEQGLGDEIMTFMTIQWLSQNVTEAYFQVSQPMINLLKNTQDIPKNIKLFMGNNLNKPLFEFDIQLAAMDLLGFYYIQNGSGPKSPVNIGINKSNKNKPVVGIVPYTKPNTDNNKLKDFDPKPFEKYTDIFDYRLPFIYEKDHPKLPTFLQNIPTIPKEKDFWFTAQELLKMDYIFAADTSVAHLAAYLNLKNVYVVMKKVHDWRWYHLNSYNVKLIEYQDLSKKLKEIAYDIDSKDSDESN